MTLNNVSFIAIFDSQYLWKAQQRLSPSHYEIFEVSYQNVTCPQTHKWTFRHMNMVILNHITREELFRFLFRHFFLCIVWTRFKVRLTKQCLRNLRKFFSWSLDHFLLLWTLLKWKDLLILWRTSEYSTTTHASKTCKITPWRQKYENLFLYTSYELNSKCIWQSNV